MKLYYFILSTYSQKALLAFYEKGVEFTPVAVNLPDPVANAEYRKIYPLGKVPLLIDEQDDQFIPESSIIIEFLESEYPDQGTQLIPANKTEARRVRFKDRMCDLYVNTPITTLYFESMKPEAKQNSEAIAKAKATLDIMYQYIEHSLVNSTYAQGHTFSMADCAAFPGLFYAQKLYPFSQYPNIVAYFSRLMARDSVKRLMAEVLPALTK